MALAILEDSTEFEYVSTELTERLGQKDLVSLLRAVVYETPFFPGQLH